MVTKDVIKEIYKKYSTPPKDIESLQLPHYIGLLKAHHNLEINGEEIVNHNLDDFNPFRRFLMRRLTAVLNFDKVVAFAFSRHIIFFDKESENIHVHFKPEKRNFFSRLFRH